MKPFVAFSLFVALGLCLTACDRKDKVEMAYEKHQAATEAACSILAGRSKASTNWCRGLPDGYLLETLHLQRVLLVDNPTMFRKATLQDLTATDDAMITSFSYDLEQGGQIDLELSSTNMEILKPTAKAELHSEFAVAARISGVERVTKSQDEIPEWRVYGKLVDMQEIEVK